MADVLLGIRRARRDPRVSRRPARRSCAALQPRARPRPSEPESLDAFELVSDQSDGLVDAHAIDIDADPGASTLARKRTIRRTFERHLVTQRIVSAGRDDVERQRLQNPSLLVGFDVSRCPLRVGASCSANPRRVRGRWPPRRESCPRVRPTRQGAPDHSPAIRRRRTVRRSHSSTVTGSISPTTITAALSGRYQSS